MGGRLKAMPFRALELPGGKHAHYFLQRHVTRTWPRPAATLLSLQNISRRVVEDYARHVGGTPSSVLEIGAGRDLAVPLALRRLGAAKGIASDDNRRARLDLIQHARRPILTGQVARRRWDHPARLGIGSPAPHDVTARE